MDSNSLKRNRSGNFDQDDIDLFMSLVGEQKALIDSSKQEDKKKGWDLIHVNFNANCAGVKRDVSALKMKLKNLKAFNKKQKTGNSTRGGACDETQDSDQEASMLGGSSVDKTHKNPRKRTKMFTADETVLLYDLVAKYFSNLDSSLTRESLESRNNAWKQVTEEFNNSKVSDIKRDINELKIKHKNMKAQRINFKTENEEGKSTVDQYTEPEASPEDITPRSLRSKAPETSTNNIISDVFPVRNFRDVSTLSRPKVVPRKTYDDLLDGLDTSGDLSDEDDYAPPVPPSRKRQVVQPRSPIKEDERIRRENLLLKNAVLRKKERLLELQIALAERNLRRHQY